MHAQMSGMFIIGFANRHYRLFMAPNENEIFANAHISAFFVISDFFQILFKDVDYQIDREECLANESVGNFCEKGR